MTISMAISVIHKKKHYICDNQSNLSVSKMSTMLHYSIAPSSVHKEALTYLILCNFLFECKNEYMIFGLPQSNSLAKNKYSLQMYSPQAIQDVDEFVSSLKLYYKISNLSMIKITIIHQCYPLSIICLLPIQWKRRLVGNRNMQKSNTVY